MPRQSNSSYQQPANTAAVSGQAISSSAYNSLISDISTEITNSLDRGGRGAMTAPLPMGGQKIVGMADPTISTDGATKNYVDTATAAFFSTGDVKLTLKIVADAGWILFDDGTFGSSTSGSSSRSNNDTQNLFNLFYNNLSDTAAPLLTSGGASTTRAAQTNAATAWAANCRMSLPKTLGRALGIAGSGSGLTARALGSVVGEENHLLSTTELPAHTHSGTTSPMNTNQNHSHGGPASGGSFVSTNGAGINLGTTSGGTGLQNGGATNSVNLDHNHPFTTDNGTGGGAAHNNMQPTVFMNAMVKL